MLVPARSTSSMVRASMCKTSSLCSSTYVTHTMPVGSVPHVSDTVLIAAAARKRKRKSEYKCRTLCNASLFAANFEATDGRRRTRWKKILFHVIVSTRLFLSEHSTRHAQGNVGKLLNPSKFTRYLFRFPCTGWTCAPTYLRCVKSSYLFVQFFIFVQQVRKVTF